MGITSNLAAVLQHVTPTRFAMHGLGLSLLIIVTRFLWSWYRLRHIPGPPLGAFSSLWIIRKSLSGRFHEHLRDVAETYGTLVRVGPNDLVTSDLNVLRRMSAVRSPYTKGIFYETGRIVPEADTVVSLRDDQLHAALRAKMGPAFYGRENEGFGFGAGIDRQVSQLVALIDSKYVSRAGDSRPVQFFQKVSFFALDVIGDISFGNAFGYLSQDEDLYRYHEINDESLVVMHIMGAIPWLAKPMQKWPMRLLLPKEGDKVGFGRLMGLAKSFVDKRLEPGAKPQKDMMQAFINSGMTPTELTQQVFVQIIAGSISTTTAICMTLLCLITTPSAYFSLRREIDDGIGQGKISTPISDAEAKKLPYLQAVIREGLRFYPPVIGLGSKQVPKGGDYIDGHFVPEGTQVGQNIFGLMRSKDIWGADADVFRPERWLDADPEQLKAMNMAVDLDFGFGKYQCLGKPIAMMELNKIFPELLRRYDFAVANPQTPVHASSAIFWVVKDFWLHITARKDI